MASLPKLNKIRIKTKLAASDYEAIRQIGAQTGLSASECVENMILLIKGIYEQDETEAVIYALRKLKYDSLANVKSLRVMPPIRCSNMTIHPSVYDFAVFLKETYPPVFSSATEAIALCAHYCCRFWKNAAHRRYLCKRLCDIKMLRRS